MTIKTGEQKPPITEVAKIHPPYIRFALNLISAHFAEIKASILRKSARKCDNKGSQTANYTLICEPLP